MKDLFGEEVKLFAPKKKGRRRVVGYAGMPGKGPEGETCGTCNFRGRYHSSSGKKTWNKCCHPKAYVSSCAATDIKVGTPSCEFWRART